jgi:hypothetical protein
MECKACHSAPKLNILAEIGLLRHGDFTDKLEKIMIIIIFIFRSIVHQNAGKFGSRLQASIEYPGGNQPISPRRIEGHGCKNHDNSCLGIPLNLALRRRPLWFTAAGLD